MKAKLLIVKYLRFVAARLLKLANRLSYVPEVRESQDDMWPEVVVQKPELVKGYESKR